MTISSVSAKPDLWCSRGVGFQPASEELPYNGRLEAYPTYIEDTLLDRQGQRPTDQSVEAPTERLRVDNNLGLATRTNQKRSMGFV